jgi:hypothetical protein
MTEDAPNRMEKFRVRRKPCATNSEACPPWPTIEQAASAEEPTGNLSPDRPYNGDQPCRRPKCVGIGKTVQKLGRVRSTQDPTKWILVRRRKCTKCGHTWRTVEIEH